MTHFYRPSDGRISQRKHIKLNVHGYKVGERVLYDGAGGWNIGTIDGWTGGDGNTARIGIEAVSVTIIKGRVPAGADESALLGSLQEAAAEYGRVTVQAHHDLAERRRELLALYGVA